MLIVKVPCIVTNVMIDHALVNRQNGSCNVYISDATGLIVTTSHLHVAGIACPRIPFAYLQIKCSL